MFIFQQNTCCRGRSTVPQLGAIVKIQNPPLDGSVGWSIVLYQEVPGWENSRRCCRADHPRSGDTRASPGNDGRPGNGGRTVRRARLPGTERPGPADGAGAAGAAGGIGPLPAAGPRNGAGATGDEDSLHCGGQSGRPPDDGTDAGTTGRPDDRLVSRHLSSRPPRLHPADRGGTGATFLFPIMSNEFHL